MALGLGVTGLFLGAMGKSAQFPLHIWLPDAMEGPTPVSALIHAATMVAAGVFLMVRSAPLLARVPDLSAAVLAIGCLTALLGASMALTERDVKRILAFSTVSQLGMMMAAVGAGAPLAAFFHLVTHAAFKALLFLAAGS
jgi:NADH:ubiquinone oxidoreductase subunit 5 (subunit L)/multisubunit Na+/H+ antiporter MnhA subunit